eukprot:GHVU01102906.1.p1 GENE.GHVU01102906.1~~GHVU01102906.1.p1  ORF type:complete len:232 (-),score=22.64 GHVU01102906.1:429-1124(-)
MKVHREGNASPAGSWDVTPHSATPTWGTENALQPHFNHMPSMALSRAGTSNHDSPTSADTSPPSPFADPLSKYRPETPPPGVEITINVEVTGSLLPPSADTGRGRSTSHFSDLKKCLSSFNKDDVDKYVKRHELSQWEEGVEGRIEVNSKGKLCPMLPAMFTRQSRDEVVEEDTSANFNRKKNRSSKSVPVPNDRTCVRFDDDVKGDGEGRRYPKDRSGPHLKTPRKGDEE